MSQILRLKIIIIGEHAVGKTSLVKKYVEGEFTRDYRPTIGTNVFIKKVILDDMKISVNVWDVAGQERFQNMRFAYYKGSQGVIIVGDLSRKQTFKQIEKFWAPDLYKYVPKTTPVILLANKNDLKSEINDSRLKDVVNEIGAISGIKTSAKTGSHVDEAFLLLLKHIVGFKEKEMEEIEAV
ncbi:MAG: GTP-binding protein [archaeon]|nr:GTP-binding protein [archaeon]